MTDYVAGTTVPLTYRNLVGGVLTDTTVSVKVQRADGTFAGPFTDPDVTRTSVGTYQYLLTTVETGPTGQYVAVWTTPTGAERQEFDVTRAYISNPQAWNSIARMVAKDNTPTLSDQDVDDLVAIAARPDGTYDLNRAAAEGWRWKAAKVAGYFNITIDGGGINRGDLLEHCTKMVELYTKGRGRVRSIRTAAGTATDTPYRYLQAGEWL